MSTIHISSLDLEWQSGTPYTGNIEFGKTIHGIWKVVDSFFEAGDMPYVFPNSNILAINMNATPGSIEYIDFGTLSTSDDSGAIKTAFELPASITAVFTVVKLPDGRYQINTDAAVDFRWQEGLSSLNNTFHGRRINEINKQQIFWGKKYVDVNPDLIELHFDAAETPLVSARQSKGGDLVLSRTRVVPSNISLENKNSLVVSVQRLTNPMICPTLLHWDVLLSKS